MTISEALTYLKSLKQRHAQLSALQQDNSLSIDRYSGERQVEVKKPNYSVKAIDKKINLAAAEMRKIDSAIKKANATTEITYTPDESVFDAVE